MFLWAAVRPNKAATARHLLWWVLGMAVGLSACADGDSDTGETLGEAEVSSVHVRFEPRSSGPIPFGDVPFPDSLYRTGDDSQIQVDFPWSDDADGAFTEALHSALGELDGFGALGPVFFSLDGGDIDPDSLPVDADASMGDGASVFVLDIDTNSPNAFTRVPVEVAWDGAQQRLIVTPADGEFFFERRLYAAVITREVTDRVGLPIEPASGFAAVRDASGVLADAGLERARQQYQSVFEVLVREGLARSAIAGLAVFRVQSVMPVMAEAKALVDGYDLGGFTLIEQVAEASDLDAVLGVPVEPEPGLAVAGGVVHNNVGEMVHGTFKAYDFASADGTTPGTFERDESGNLTPKRVGDVPFTLWLPKARRSDVALGLVVFLHDLGGERSDALAIVNRFAGANLAVLALDAPYSGSRSSYGDVSNRFTGEGVPDGFGDGSDSLFAADLVAGPWPAYHPFYYRDALRQGALDVVTLLAAAGQLGLSAITSQPLDVRRVAAVGVGTGAHMAMMAATLDDRLELVSLAFAGGHETRSWLDSPDRSGLFEALASRLGLPDTAAAAQEPGLALYQLLLDGVEPTVWAAGLGMEPVNVLQLLAVQDASVAESAAARLGRVLEVTYSENGLDNHDEEIAAEPMADRVSRHQVRFPEATHTALYSTSGRVAYEQPFERPFKKLDAVQKVENPTEAALELLLSFVSTYRACVASSSDVCQGRLTGVASTAP